MKNVISARDIEELIRSGGDVRSIPADAILTPSARDILRDLEMSGKIVTGVSSALPAKAPAASAPAAATTIKVTAKSSKAELESFYHSAPILAHREMFCDFGRRLWAREYVDGNGGNIALRLSDDVVLCTPTMVSKGFMKPDDMCLVDIDGNQIFGAKKRTSEVLMHLQMMKKQPKMVASVHCHPPYATAFAVAGLQPPTCMIPEFEVFCAVAIAPYRTPGSPEMGELVANLVDKHNTILMANHGVVTWSHNTVEEAFWRMEIIEAYCRTMLVASQLGKPAQSFSGSQMKDLLKIKQGLGFVDPRFGLKECELCDNSEWRPGVQCVVPPKESETGALDPDAEKLVQSITEQVMSKLK